MSMDNGNQIKAIPTFIQPSKKLHRATSKKVMLSTEHRQVEKLFNVGRSSLSPQRRGSQYSNISNLYQSRTQLLDD